VAWCDLEREGGTRLGPWGRARRGARVGVQWRRWPDHFLRVW
jgi:hypothetical protein